jgi:Zn-dependent peptidase ImmA (M78 family)
MSTRLEIKNDIIQWAIARAGYKWEAFVKNFPRVKDWIEGKSKPTLRQLEVFARKVHVPLGYLFLEEPPKEEVPIPFFRTSSWQGDKVSLNVYDTILLLQRRQEWLSEYLKEKGYDRIPFVDKYNQNTGYKKIVGDIRDILQLPEEWADAFQTWEEALKHLTTQIEEAGIVVTFNSVVGNNNKRKIKVDECRGFVLVDEYAPFMFINNDDVKAAQMFTLLHELAHIWIGKSAGFDFRQLQPASDPIETFCDQVAAEFLVPEASFLKAWEEQGDIKLLSKKFKVSPIVIARRALDLGKMNKADFFSFYNEHLVKAQKQKEARSGGDFYATSKNRLSLKFMAHVNQAIKENHLLYRDAYQLTQLKGDTYQKFVQEYLQ